jgi:exodeoxyribonuclease VII small subunit
MVMAEKKSADFEKSLERLEELVEEMEGGELSLEEMIKHFEEGSKLVGLCSKKLNEVEQKIEKLVKKDGELQEVPFAPEEGE